MKDKRTYLRFLPFVFTAIVSSGLIAFGAKEIPYIATFLIAGLIFGLASALVNPVKPNILASMVFVNGVAWLFIAFIIHQVDSVRFPVLLEIIFLAFVGAGLGFSIYRIFEYHHQVYLDKHWIFSIAAAFCIGLSHAAIEASSFLAIADLSAERPAILNFNVQIVLGFLLSLLSPASYDKEKIDNLVNSFGDSHE